MMHDAIHYTKDTSSLVADMIKTKALTAISQDAVGIPVSARSILRKRTDGRYRRALRVSYIVTEGIT